jgi:transcriptional regulator EpsA
MTPAKSDVKYPSNLSEQPRATGGSAHLSLSPAQADAFVRVVEAAPAVRRRHQYFVWTQSQLQTLLSHQILVCGAYVRQRRDLVFETFHSVALAPELLGVLADAQGPLMRAVVAAWVQAHGLPLILPVARLQEAAATPAVALLLDRGIECLLVHGVARPQRPSEIECLFVFANPGQAPGPSAPAMAELLVPYLHWIWQRVMEAEREWAQPLQTTVSSIEGLVVVASRRVTDRERQVLQWVRDGKSNHEIAELLAISPLTVKNHVQKILRRLGASNRTQAVAEAIARGLLPGATPR